MAVLVHNLSRCLTPLTRDENSELITGLTAIYLGVTYVFSDVFTTLSLSKEGLP